MADPEKPDDRTRAIRPPGRPSGTRSGPRTRHSPAQSSECGPSRAADAAFARPDVRTRRISDCPTAHVRDPRPPDAARHRPPANLGRQDRDRPPGRDPRQLNAASGGAEGWRRRADRPEFRLGAGQQKRECAWLSDRAGRPTEGLGTTNRSGPVSPRRLGPTDACRPAPQSGRLRDPPVRPPERDRRRRPSVSATARFPAGPVPPNGHQQEDFGPSPEGADACSAGTNPAFPSSRGVPQHHRGPENLASSIPQLLQFRDRALRELFGPFWPRQRKLWRTNRGDGSSTSKGWLRSRSKLRRGICGGS